MTPEELEQAAGANGALARLLVALPIDNIGPWVDGEVLRNTRDYDIARCIAEWCSGAIFGLALRSNDPEQVISGKGDYRGMVDLIDNSLTEKLNRHMGRKTAAGLYLPNGCMGFKN